MNLKDQLHYEEKEDDVKEVDETQRISEESQGWKRRLGCLPLLAARKDTCNVIIYALLCHFCCVVMREDARAKKM